MRPPRCPAPPTVARLRRLVYLLLAAGFSPPTAVTIRQLRDGRARHLAGASAWTPVLPSIDCALTAVGAWLGPLGRRDPARAARALGPRYQALFVGPYALGAPPWESCYLGASGAVMGESAVAVARAYAGAGHALRPDVRQPPDHIAFELEFMALLAGEEARRWRTLDAAAVRACLAQEQRFLVEHLSRWVPPFVDRVKATARSRFYAALASATAAWVPADLGLVGALEAIA